MSPLPPPAVALAIGAHPDDVEFCCGATLARWARAGTVVHHLICTDGSKGTWDPKADTHALVARRRGEQAAAAAALGATGEVVHLGATDGELTADRDTIAAVAREIRRLRPDVVLGHDPWKRYRLHPDHRAAGWITTDAVVAARDPHFFPEQLTDGLTHHRPTALLLFEADEPNHAEPTDETSIVAKLDALERHESQLETTHFYRLPADGATGTDDVHDPAADALAGFRTREREKLDEWGRQLGTGPAEIFRLIDDL